jgi:hypothetical protein
MGQVLAWYSRFDSVIVDKSTVLRVIDHDADSVTLALEDLAGKVLGQVSAVIDEWRPAVHGLEVRYDGQYPDAHSPTHTKPGIVFRDIGVIDVRPHSFRGTPVAWRDDRTRY